MGNTYINVKNFKNAYLEAFEKAKVKMTKEQASVYEGIMAGLFTDLDNMSLTYSDVVGENE